MLKLKSNVFALMIAWLAFLAFVAHTFDCGRLHCVCLHEHGGVPVCELEFAEDGFTPSDEEFEHCCGTDCELLFDSPELVESVFLFFFLSALGKVEFSNVRRLLGFLRAFYVPLGRNVFLFFESLLI